MGLVVGLTIGILVGIGFFIVVYFCCCRKGKKTGNIGAAYWLAILFVIPLDNSTRGSRAAPDAAEMTRVTYDSSQGTGEGGGTAPVYADVGHANENNPVVLTTNSAYETVGTGKD